MINPDLALNHLEVVAQGHQIAVYANDQWLNTITDSALSGGQIGLYVGVQEPDGQARFSNLRVSRINHSLPLPTGTPTPPFVADANNPSDTPNYGLCWLKTPSLGNLTPLER